MGGGGSSLAQDTTGGLGAAGPLQTQGVPAVSVVTGQASLPGADRCRKRVRHRCGGSWSHRADYLYVLPAIVVMLIVIAYPIYYTIELSASSKRRQTFS